MSVFIKNSGNPLRVLCNGKKIILLKGLNKVSDSDLDELKKVDFFNSRLDNDVLKIESGAKAEKIKDSKKSKKIVSVKDDNEDD